MIVEGCDGAGKTTLVTELVEKFGFEIGQRATADRTKLYTVTRQDTYTALAEAVNAKSPAKLWDRLYYSELVYADATGRENEFNANEQSFIQATIEAIECPVILCIPPFDVVVANEAGTEQMEGVHENLSTIYNGYINLLRDGVFLSSTIVYDYTDSTGDIFGGWRGGLGMTYTKDELFEIVADYLIDRKTREWAKS